MSENQTDLGPMPEPEAVEPQLHPGGPDAVLDLEVDPVVPDVSADANPATEDSPAGTRGGEDTSTEATKDGDDVDPTEESPA